MHYSNKIVFIFTTILLHQYLCTSVYVMEFWIKFNQFLQARPSISVQQKINITIIKGSSKLKKAIIIFIPKWTWCYLTKSIKVNSFISYTIYLLWKDRKDKWNSLTCKESEWYLFSVSVSCTDLLLKATMIDIRTRCCKIRQNQIKGGISNRKNKFLQISFVSLLSISLPLL